MALIQAQQVTFFRDNGFLILKAPFLQSLRERIQADLKVVAIALLERNCPRDVMTSLRDMSFLEVFNWTIAHEAEMKVAFSRSFYEVFPTIPSIINLIADNSFLQVARELDVKFPIASTLPLLRIDRPKDKLYGIPTHQDIWYSMLSMNSVTFWFPVLPVVKEMGPLQIIPGTHKQGALPIKQWTRENPFTTKTDYADDKFEKVLLADDELLVFNQCLVHRGGWNESEKARLTIQLRYNDLMTLKEPTASFVPQYSKFLVEAQDELLQKSQDANL